mgnify:CR=1 FL=1|jgi:predicted ATP-grasp superfamily ATP-dependent carboligase
MAFFPVAADGASIETSTANSALIVPAVSFANIGQLTCDLILNSSNDRKKKLGYFHSKYVESCCFHYPFTKYGHDAATEEGICTAQELYRLYADSEEVCVLQRRSMCFPGTQPQYARELVDWVAEKKFGTVILLSGADKGRGRGDQETESFMNYAATTAALKDTALMERLEQAQCRPLESAKVEFPDDVFSAGVSKEMFRCCEEKGVALVVLVLFTYEGNNLSDCGKMCAVLKQAQPIVDAVCPRLVTPPSWSNTLL